MKYVEVVYLSKEERKELEDKGLFCYDLRSTDSGGWIGTIEKTVVVNNVGSIITDKKLPLESKNSFIDYDEFISQNENAGTLNKLLENDVTKKKTYERVR